MSVWSMPQAEKVPGLQGMITSPISSSSASQTACIGPAPPNATSPYSRGSIPCLTVIVRIASAMLALTIASIPSANSVSPSESCPARERGASDRASDGAGEQRLDRLAARLGGRRDPAVRLHHVELRGDGQLDEAGFEVAQVVLDARSDVRVHHRGRGALVLAPFPRDLVGERDRQARALPLELVPNA